MTVKNSMLAAALCAVAVVVVASPAAGAPAPFTSVEPADSALLNTAMPTLTWNTTTSPAGIDAYGVFVDDELVDVVDPSSCGSTCASVLEEPLTEDRHVWSVVALDGDDEGYETAQREFVVDITPPEIRQPTPIGEKAGFSRPGCDPNQYFGATDLHGPVVMSYFVNGQPLTSLCGLPSGDSSLTVRARDQAGNETTITRVVVNYSKPFVTIEGPLDLASGTAANFRATVQTGTGVPPFTYRWAEGTDPIAAIGSTASFSWSADSILTGRPLWWRRTISVVVTDADGKVGVDYHVVQLAPPGKIGLTIAGGARYTKNRKVPVSLVWPVGARTYTLSDGTRSLRKMIRATDMWDLTGPGTTKVPQAVRVQFDGGPVYQDDVVLDLEPPKVTSARVRGRTLRVKAADAVSGPAWVQVTTRKGASGPRRPYGTKFKVTTARWVRVIDRAGNRSDWARIRRA